MKSVFASITLWLTFLAGLAACVASGAVFDGTAKNLATYGGIALSLLAGSRIARKEPVKSFLASRPVLWFLFLFNGTVAAFCAVAVDGTQGIMAAAGMGVVSLGAGLGLLQKRGASQPERA
ncbi:hypothetical protein ABZ915_00950 [Streptomyces sp. NPDC046915]|uniref:hypothetical protein n=1 Tax=Streptomyces sp. NPDC046915 TaxID=3155257 RepID=UPI0033CDFF4C